MGYVDEVLADMPLAWWRQGEAEGATTMTDSSGNARHGTYLQTSTIFHELKGVTDVTAAHYADDSLGSPANGEGPNDAALALTTNGTLEGWFRWWPGGGDTAIFRDFTSAGGWILALAVGTVIHVRAGGTNFNTGVSTATVRDGNWHHIVLTKNGGTVTLYIDGASVYSSGGAGSTAAVMPWKVMRNGRSAGGHARGIANEIAIYNHALSSARVSAHYNTVSDKNVDLFIPTSGIWKIRHYAAGSYAPTGASLELVLPSVQLVASNSTPYPGTGELTLGTFNAGDRLRFRIRGSDSFSTVTVDGVARYYLTPPPGMPNGPDPPAGITGAAWLIRWEDRTGAAARDFNDLFSYIWTPGTVKWILGRVNMGNERTGW